jgi:hypothetical protein
MIAPAMVGSCYGLGRWYPVLALAALAAACGDDNPAAATGGRDAGRDSALDAADAPASDWAGTAVDAGDGPGDRAADAGVEVGGDASAVAMCPGGTAARDVCGCGCCGGQAQGRACWYPALGQQAAAIPDPRPADCSTVGCSQGVRYLCCADPGGSAGGAGSYCARNLATAIERFQVTRRESGDCTFLVLAQSPNEMGFPVATTQGWSVTGGRRPCDASGPATAAIGGLGTAMVTPAGTTGRVTVHVALFFDDGTGVASATRLDVDDLVLSPGCP